MARCRTSRKVVCYYYGEFQTLEEIKTAISGFKLNAVSGRKVAIYSSEKFSGSDGTIDLMLATTTTTTNTTRREGGQNWWKNFFPIHLNSTAAYAFKSSKRRQKRGRTIPIKAFISLISNAFRQFGDSIFFFFLFYYLLYIRKQSELRWLINLVNLVSFHRREDSVLWHDDKTCFISRLIWGSLLSFAVGYLTMLF